MPNLPLHIDLVRIAAQRIGHPALDENMGHVFLGATSPDMRAITGKRREEYHFTTLDFEAIGDGVRGLFDSHPRLAKTAGLSGPTLAFIAGYISHLITDETWVVEVYRPYFGNPSVFEDKIHGKVMDRAMQLDLDRLSMETTRAAIPQIAAARDGVYVGFISSDTLARWREWVVGLLERDFTWDRLAFMARRIAAGNDDHPAHGIADEFVRGLPESLERLHRVVPSARVEQFRRRAVDNLSSAMGDYLS